MSDTWLRSWRSLPIGHHCAVTVYTPAPRRRRLARRFAWMLASGGALRRARSPLKVCRVYKTCYFRYFIEQDPYSTYEGVSNMTSVRGFSASRPVSSNVGSQLRAFTMEQRKASRRGFINLSQSRFLKK